VFGQQPLGMDGATLRRARRGFRQSIGAWQRYGCDSLISVNARDLLDEIGLALHIGAPGRRLGPQPARALLDRETERAQDARRFICRHFDSPQTPDAFGPQLQLALPARHLAGANDMARLAATDLQYQSRCHLRAPFGRDGVEAALEAIARIA